MTVTVGGLVTLHNAAADNNFNTPTNPFFTTSITADTDRVFGIVVEDDTDTTVIYEPITSAGLVTEYSNIENTNGMTIRCYNSHTTTGLNLSSINLTANDYFVLVHSDDANLHHFAKITEVKAADASGDMFEFEPKLGNQIAKDTKFMVFKGPTVTNKILAISCGLIANPHNDVVCAQPLWYFYNDKLDKKNELNHNTKYFVKINEASSGANVSLSSPSHTSAFVTVNEYRNKIIDYSKFSYVIKTKDNLKERDDPDTGSTANHNEGASVSYNATAYESSFWNARRNDNNILVASGNDFTGPNRYLTYTSSPSSVNLLPVAVNTYVQESIDGKAGFAETKIIDDGNIYKSKIAIGNKYTVRQEIGSGTFHEWVEIATLGALGASSSDSRNYAITMSNGLVNDLSKYINAADEIKIGNRIIRVGSVATGSITLMDFSRLETESAFNTTASNVTGLTEGTKVYRRRFNLFDNTLLVDFDFADNNHDKLKVVVYSKSHKTSEISVVAPDTGITSQYKLLFLSGNQNYRGRAFNVSDDLQYIKGDFIVLNEVFTGAVEKIEDVIEDGIAYVIIQGRNTFSKLIDPITNKDTLFSEDVIYSSKSPYNDLTSLSKTGNCSVHLNTISSISSSHSFTKNDKIWNGNGIFIGEVSADTTGTSVTLFENAKTSMTGKTLYIENNKKYIYNKALSSNPYISSATTLSGASDKGLFFKTGTRLDSGEATPLNTFNALVENGTLAGTSSDTDANAVGYKINKAENILTDSMFSSLIDGFDDDVINTLIDFNIMSVDKNNNNTIIKLAPHIPLTLGRSQINYANNKDTGTYTHIGRMPSDSQDNNYTHSFNITNLQGVATFALQKGDAIYVKVLEEYYFVGRLIGRRRPITVSNSVQIHMESPFFKHAAWVNKDLYVRTDKKQHDLILTNGGHLHGGKIIALLGPNNAILNYEIFDDTNQVSYWETFGMPIFRIINLEKGEIGPTVDFRRPEVMVGVDVFNKNKKFYQPSLEFNYYATAYKGANIATVKKTGTGTNLGWPTEQRGIIPITGSNYYDRTRFPNSTNYARVDDYMPITFNYNFNTTEGGGTSIYSKSNFYQIDPTASRLFLFVNSDKYPYSSTRKDSLLNSATRTLTDYGLLTLEKPNVREVGTEKESLVGSTSRISYLDNMYNHSNILSSDKTLSDLTAFGLMRLTECVYDFMWNPINPEHKQNKTMRLNEIGNHFSFDLGIAGTSISSWGGTNGNIAEFQNGSHGLIVGDILVDFSTTADEIREVIGTVSAVSGEFVTIDTTTAHQSQRTSPLFPTGTVYKINKADSDLEYDVRGLSDGYLMNDEDIIMSHSVVFNGHLGGYSLDTSSDWYKLFTGTGDKYPISQVTGTDILLPINFQGGTNLANTAIVTEVSMNCTRHSDVNSPILLGIADTSLLSVGDIVKENSSLGISETEGNLAHIISIDSSSQITLSQGCDHAGTASVTFIHKRAEKEQHGNAIFAWWDKLNLFGNHNNLNDETNWTMIKATILDTHPVNNASNFANEGTTVRLNSALWSVVKTPSASFTFPVLRTDFKYATHQGAKLATDNTNDKSVDGAVLGYKVQIYGGDVGSSIVDNSDIKAAGVGTTDKNYREYRINHQSKYKYLELVDLTGCYLVPTVGTREDGTVVAVSSGATQSSSAHNLTTNNILYVVSHEYDAKTALASGGTNDGSILVLDGQLVDDTYYNVMQPNPVAFWPNSPEKIKINELSCKYTKKSNSDVMYETFNDYDISSGHRRLGANHETTLEGIQSMYVAIDIDNKAGNNNTVLKTYTELKTAIGEINKEVCVSDGDTNVLTGLKTDFSSNFSFDCDFSKLKEKLKGVVSVSETFELTVAGDVTTDDKRAIIGTTVNIVKESEDLIEELLEENGVNYSLTKESYPIYSSPDFQGGNTYAVINYLLSLKEKKITDNAGTLTITNDDNRVVKTTFTDDEILEYKQIKSQFDFYNEITVYGANVKSTRKNIRSIKKDGRKTSEVFLKQLVTQADVDNKAQKLLKLHSNPENNLELKLPIDKIKTVYAGDLVNCEIKAANIPMNQYIILETIHQTDGIISLKLGKYVRGLDDTFAELLIDSNREKSYNRKKIFSETEHDFDFFNNIKIKEMQLTLRKRTTTGAMLGFTHNLNTDTTPLGIGGEITHTVLLEEDL